VNRGATRLLATLLAVAVVCVCSRARAGDPYLEWYTIATPHFRVHYHSGLGEVAQRTADLAEAIHRRLTPHLGHVPTELTHIALTDETDGANGSATALPYNQVRLFVSAPDDMSPLGDYDSWLLELITHEYTHILHVDNISGPAALLNRVLGKTFAPNQAQPRWILEGLAVAMETSHTSGGRLRSTQFDMYLRADVLEGTLAPLDQISNPTRRWPSGNLWYLYGGKFIEWINDVYGPDTFAAVATDYGSNVIPWGINRSIRRVTGRTYPELYQGWEHYLQRRYGAQAALVKQRGLREGVRLTHHGRNAAYPRFVPPRCVQDATTPTLVYSRDDGRSTPGIYGLKLERNENRDAELFVRAAGRVGSFDVDCGFIYETTAPSRRRYYFNDLFRKPANVAADRLGRSSRRLTLGRRAREPDVSPDGRRVAYVTNRAGTSTLRVADLTPSHEIRRERRLVASAEFEQAYTPRWSPDGTKIAYSAWTRGGYRDIRIVDVASGRFIELAHDRAIDQQPVWSGDGATLFFVSDRTGIANVYAYELATGTLQQVTNVLTGAYMPAISPDESTLVYVGYTSEGYDLFTMPLDRSRWLQAPSSIAERPAVPPEDKPLNWTVQRYNALSTLRPRSFEVQYGPSVFGQGLRLTTRGADMVGLHAFSASFAIDFEQVDPQATVDYTYARLPFDFRATVFHSAAPRRYRFGEEQQVLTERMNGATTGISYTFQNIFDAQSVSLSYTAAQYATNTRLGPNIDPFSPVPRDPGNGFLGVARLGYAYSNAEIYDYSISAERGFSLFAGLDHASEVTGSEETMTAVSGSATAYFRAPWLRHHVLALALSGGASIGTYARRGLFFTGGFVDQGLVDVFSSSVRQGAFVLRGYAPGQFAGSQFNLLNLEYRFPIAYVDRGLSTLPAFLRGVSGTLFADYGGAFDRLSTTDPLASYHLGIGAEAWVQIVLGYFLPSTIRFGVAKGTSDVAPDFQTYTVLSAGF
jgi:hypothetical protein